MIRHLVLCVTILAMAAHAQTTTATLRGEVRDPSGANVAGAAVRLENASQGTVHEVHTNADGVYLIPFLQPGQYSLTVQHPGFAQFHQTGIQLDVQQVVTIDVQLPLGSTQTTVDVTATSVAVDTASSVVMTTVENKAVTDLPLNGRVSLGLSYLAPGVVPGHGTAGSSIGVVNASAYPTAYSPWIAGGRNSTNDIWMDGVPLGVPNAGCCGGTLIFGVTGPTVDAVQEFSVITSAPPAEFGRTGGGIINVASKQGASQLHGSLYEFVRNSAMDANNYFSNAAGVAKASFQRNQYGGTVGGPVFIPNLYNGAKRTFFFFDMERSDVRVPDLFTTTVPLDAWKQGDFSNLRNTAGQPITIYDPTTTSPTSDTRTAFPGNIIPVSRMDPVAVNLMKYFPEPNATPVNPYTQVNNWFAPNKDKSDSLDFGIRLDHDITDKWRTFARFTHGTITTVPANVFDSPATPEGRGVQYFTRTAVAWDHIYVFNSSTILNMRYGLARDTNDIIPLSNGFKPSELGFPAYMDAEAALNEFRFPTFAVQGFTSLSQTGNGNTTAAYSQNVVASLTKVVNKHIFKTGFEFRKLFLNIWAAGNPAGTFSFNSTWTQQSPLSASATQGFGMASLLLGVPTSGAQSNTIYQATSSGYYAGYLQDDWRVMDRLTLNLGVRYDVDIPKTDRFNQLSRFDINAPSPIAGMVPGYPNLKGVMNFAGPGHREQAPVDWNDVSPRFGFAFKVDSMTSIRGGYALLYGPSILQPSRVGTEGFSTTTSMVVSSNGQIPLNYLRNPFPNGFNRPLGATPGPMSGPSTDLGLDPGASWIPFNNSPAIQEWNLTVQRQLPGRLIVEAGYIGNKGNHLVDGEAQNYNQLPASDLSLGKQLTNLMPNPFYGVIVNPTSTLSAPTVTLKQLLSPYPQYTSMTLTGAADSNSIYHSFTLRAERRFAAGISFLVSYTGAKLIDDGTDGGTLDAVNGAAGHQNVYDRGGDRSLSVDDVSSRLVASGTLELPFGRGRPFLAHLSTPLNAVLGGWQLNPILTIQSGLPVALTQSVNQTGLGNSLQRPDNNGHTANLGGGASIGEWFNTSTLSVAPAFTFGNVSRTLPDVRQPGICDLDLSLFKTFRIRERASLTLRVEAFNASNHTQFGPAATTVGTAGLGVISSTGVDPREMQIALRLVY